MVSVAESGPRRETKSQEAAPASAHRLLFPDGGLERQADLDYSAASSGSDESEDASAAEDEQMHDRANVEPVASSSSVDFLPYVPYRKRAIQPLDRSTALTGALMQGSHDASEDKRAEEEEDRIDELFSAYSRILFASRSMHSAALQAKHEAGRARRYGGCPPLKGPLGKEPSIPEHIRLSVTESVDRVRHEETELQRCIQDLLSQSRSSHGCETEGVHDAVGISRQWADGSTGPVLDDVSYQWLSALIRQRSSALVLPLGADVMAPPTGPARRQTMPRRLCPAQRHGWMDDWRLIGRDGTGKCLLCSRVPCTCWDGSLSAPCASLGRDTSVRGCKSSNSARLLDASEKRQAAVGMGITGKLLESEAASVNKTQNGGGAREPGMELHQRPRGIEDDIAAERRRWLEEKRVQEEEEEEARFARLHHAYLHEAMMRALEPPLDDTTPRMGGVLERDCVHRRSRSTSSLQHAGERCSAGGGPEAREGCARGEPAWDHPAKPSPDGPSASRPATARQGRGGARGPLERRSAPLPSILCFAFNALCVAHRGRKNKKSDALRLSLLPRS